MHSEGRQLEDLLRQAAGLQDVARPFSGADRYKILFLGNSYNPLSTACLQSIIELGYETVVGLNTPFSQGVWGLLRKRLKSHGWGLVLRRAAHLISSSTRIALRRVGFPMSGFASLPELCRVHRLKVISSTNPNSTEFVRLVQSLKVDLIVVAGFSRILKRELIAVPPFGCINVHPSLLPLYRGPEPFFWVLANREKRTGVTIHHIDEGIDSGDIIGQRALGIRPNETQDTLTQRAGAVAAELLQKSIPQLIAGKAPRIRQDQSAATYYSFPQIGASVLNQRIRNPFSRTDLIRAVAFKSLFALDPLRDPRWSDFVHKDPRSSVFHTVPWLDSLRRTYRYEPIVYTTSPPGADLQNGFVCCLVESWLTGRRLVSLPFSDHCEPLIDSALDLETLLISLQAACKSCDWKYIEVRPVTDSLQYASARAGFGPSIQYYRHMIDLRGKEGELFRSFHKSSVQFRIKRGEKAGLTYECGRSESLLRKFYQLMLITRRRHRIPPQPEGWFRNLLTCMGDALEIHVASYRDTPVASMITLRFRDTLIYKYAGSDQAYHRFGTIPFLLWRTMQEAKANGVQAFDLGRSECDNQGLIDFKDHWASTRTLLTYWRFPTPTKGLRRKDSRAVRFAKHSFGFLPSSLQKAMGDVFYRHIG